MWRVEIHEDSETAFSTVGELSFPYDEPLLIEWEKRAKEDVIQGSSATLKLISPGDRTYVDLYSVKPCAVRLDVYRAGALYWRGTLDTELYEEPYESASGYTVSLTFSDFGVLARKKLYGHAVQSVRSILERALEAAGLAGMEIYDGYISSRVVPAARLVPETNGPTGASSQAEAGLLDELYVSGDNFYDEDGEAITAEEVVEGVLQPLALRMIQCGGLVYVYDLNGLHAGAEKVMLEWAGATQTLGTDRVYNNVRVKWSPYVRTGNLLETDCWTAAVDEGLTDFGPEYILDGGRPSADGKCRYTTYHYTTDSDVWGGRDGRGFHAMDEPDGEERGFDGRAGEILQGGAAERRYGMRGCGRDVHRCGDVRRQQRQEYGVGLHGCHAGRAARWHAEGCVVQEPAGAGDQWPYGRRFAGCGGGVAGG